MFQAERIYGANLRHPGTVKVLIDGIVKRDRLPSSNSLEAQQLLRSAWTIVDICVYNASQYKRLAKGLYLVQLGLGLVVIVLTMFRNELWNDDSSAAEADDSLKMSSSVGTFITASVLTLVTSTTAFFKPAQRWRELRSVAECLQSDVVRFRTRTGPFAVSLSNPTKPEQTLVARVQQARLDVVQMGGLAESSFERKYPDRVFQHGQNENFGTSVPDPLDLRLLSVDAPIGIKDRSVHA